MGLLDADLLASKPPCVPKPDLVAAIQAAQRQALLQHARDSKSTTLGELVGLGGDLGKMAASLTVGELLSGKVARPESSPRRRTEGKRPGRISGQVDTRTPAGRENYDAKVLAAVKAAKGDVGANTIRKKVGGTADQVRRSLHRLVKAKKVRRTGQARATKYAAR